MRLPRLFATASFRLAALYVLLFASSIAVLGTVVFLTTRSTLEQQMRNRIDTEIAILRTRFRASGLDGLVEAVRQRDREPNRLGYHIQSPAGKRLAGALPSPGERRGWTTMETGNTGLHAHHTKATSVYARVIRLKDGVLLTVGDDWNRIYRVDEAILDAFQWTLSLTLFLGISGGLILSMLFLRRIDSMTRTAEAIIDGDLKRRVLERGTADELDRLARTLNQMLDRIGALIESLRQVSNDIAHDLRTPLTRLRQGLNDTRARATSVSEYRQAIDAAVVETDGLLDTFNALLRIAQIEAGTRRAHFAPVDLGEIAATVAEAFTLTAEDTGKQITISTSAGCPCHGDHELLTQMLANLIENAICHTPSGTMIDIEVQPTSGGCRIIVADNGPGVPTAERRRILRRFYRLERSRPQAGNGLGLSLVAAVVELHDGQIAVEDNAPGLRMVITFTTASARSARPGAPSNV